MMTTTTTTMTNTVKQQAQLFGSSLSSSSSSFSSTSNGSSSYANYLSPGCTISSTKSGSHHAFVNKLPQIEKENKSPQSYTQSPKFLQLFQSQMEVTPPPPTTPTPTPTPTPEISTKYRKLEDIITEAESATKTPSPTPSPSPSPSSIQQIPTKPKSILRKVPLNNNNNNNNICTDDDETLPPRADLPTTLTDNKSHSTTSIKVDKIDDSSCVLPSNLAKQRSQSLADPAATTRTTVAIVSDNNSSSSSSSSEKRVVKVLAQSTQRINKTVVEKQQQQQQQQATYIKNGYSTQTSSFSSSSCTISSGNPIVKRVARNATTAREALLRWCRKYTQEYDNVSLSNFSSSWSNGLAFCALVHHFMPEAFDYGLLKADNPRYNFEMAFRIAEDKAGIVSLLDVDDMIEMGNSPDWKCVFTYVHSIYQRFKEPVF
jgi:hypothetical protein